MNIELFREYCLSLKGVTESFPFGEDTLVFKVMGKMFALNGLGESFRINLKCDPEWALELRERYPAVLPGYHMNKKHWNTVIVDGSISDEKLYTWIDHSYDLIVKSLPQKLKNKLQLINNGG
ncbi:MAG: MmcQ/YjbR family DNA-binding protein [Bacteroidetes bacterium]|nr:MmcQ/YjbR family DNA-binding protein [Bacteroidota bacterium]